jgi:hydroxyacyl-ACP dehydratase HTD2-like protein with hotdog domain
MTASLTSHYHRLLPEVGKEHTQELGAITRRDLERFAIASHAPWNSSAEVATAPPLLLSSVMGWGTGPPESDLDVDGTAPADTRGLPLNGVRLMGAGQGLDFHAPVREGTRVVAHTSLSDVELKQGHSGALLLLHIVRRFTDDQGRPLVTCSETFIARGGVS